MKKDVHTDQIAKGYSMIRITFFCVLLLGMSVRAAGDSTGTADRSRLDRIEKAVSNAIAKAGISLSGEFRSQFLLSRVKGEAVANARRDEPVEYTSVDFEIIGRPNAAVSGRLLFRLHEDWRNFFSSLKSPIFARWISIDGLVKNVFGYSVGDFRQKYSPLTLYSPDIDIPYEPEIFARLRRMAMDEVFLGDNERVLQGVNMNFDAEIVPAFKEVHFNLLGSRLRLAGMGGDAPIANWFESADMDKYLMGTNLDITVIPDFSFGGSVLDIFDSRYTSADTALEDASAKKQQTLIHAQRLCAGTAPFIDTKKFNLKLSAELASSVDDSVWQIVSFDTLADSTVTVDKSLESASIRGSAWHVDVSATVGLGSAGTLGVSVGYLRNGALYRNELAQTPSLMHGRIMNSENDAAGENLYSTFDVLYRHVFKFCPSEAASKNDPWNKGPMTKNAYTNGLLTQKELRERLVSDPVLFLAMPLGPATPNRAGVKAECTGDFLQKAIRFSATLKSLQELRGISGLPDSSNDTGFMRWPEAAIFEAGGGLSVDFARLGNWWPYPLVVSGGYTRTELSRDGIPLFNVSSFSTDVDFINGGIYWTFWKRASVLGGLQVARVAVNGVYSDFENILTQVHWAAGLEYKVSEGGALTGSFGFTDVSNETDDPALAAKKTDFRQWQADLYLTVRF